MSLSSRKSSVAIVAHIAAHFLRVNGAEAANLTLEALFEINLVQCSFPITFHCICLPNISVMPTREPSLL